MAKEQFHVKRGDEVVVISGAERPFRDNKTGELVVKKGKVLEVLPKKQRVIVEGVKMIKRHVKKNRDQPEGAIVEREGSVHLSNVMLASKWDARRAKLNETPAE